MRICIDIDGTICSLRKPDEDYKDVKPLAGAAETLRKLRLEGHYVILATARHMNTCDSNVGLVIARQGLTLLEWLKQHGFEYDELWFGKPYAHVYIDDRALQFNGSWDVIPEKLAQYN